MVKKHAELAISGQKSSRLPWNVRKIPDKKHQRALQSSKFGQKPPVVVVKVARS